jgi:RNA polymerase-binding transcription factor DksA
MADDERSALLDRIETDLAGIEQALARLDAGTYLACEVCGAALDDETLAQAPTTSRCPACAGGSRPVEVAAAADLAPASPAPEPAG